MSPRSSRKQQNAPAEPDIYVGLLFVSTAALLSGIIFLVMELQKYDWQIGAQ